MTRTNYANGGLTGRRNEEGVTVRSHKASGRTIVVKRVIWSLDGTYVNDDIKTFERWQHYQV